MEQAGKRKIYITNDRVRLALFLQSYAAYILFSHIEQKYLKIASKNHRKIVSYPKKTIPELLRITQILHVPYPLLKQSFLTRKRYVQFLKSEKVFSQKEKEKIKVFMAIEKELIFLIQERNNKESLLLEEYEYALLSPAIERIIGNKLRDIDDDGIFSIRMAELRTTYIRWYYKVAYQYKLPTMRIVPFLLRLIN